MRCGCSSMVELQPSKLATWVRFPSPAPASNLARLTILNGKSALPLLINAPEIVKTILQDRMSGLYLNRIGLWVKDPKAAFSFKSCGRAMDFCLRHSLWGTRIILTLEPESQAVVLTLEPPARSQPADRFVDPVRLEVN